MAHCLETFFMPLVTLKGYIYSAFWAYLMRSDPDIGCFKSIRLFLKGRIQFRVNSTRTRNPVSNFVSSVPRVIEISVVNVKDNVNLVKLHLFSPSNPISNHTDQESTHRGDRSGYDSGWIRQGMDPNMDVTGK